MVTVKLRTKIYFTFCSTNQNIEKQVLSSNLRCLESDEKMCKKVPKCNNKYSYHLRKIKINLHFINSNPNDTIINKKCNY